MGPPLTRDLVVSGLPWNTEEQDIIDYFEVSSRQMRLLIFEYTRKTFFRTRPMEANSNDSIITGLWASSVGGQKGAGEL